MEEFLFFIERQNQMIKVKVDLTGYNERMVTTETDASDPSWSSLLSN